MNFEQIFEDKRQPLRNPVSYDVGNTSYLNQQNYVYDKHFRRKAFLRHVFNNRKFRIVILSGLAVVMTILTVLVLLFTPLIRNIMNWAG